MCFWRTGTSLTGQLFCEELRHGTSDLRVILREEGLESSENKADHHCLKGIPRPGGESQEAEEGPFPRSHCCELQNVSCLGRGRPGAAEIISILPSPLPFPGKGTPLSSRGLFCKVRSGGVLGFQGPFSHGALRDWRA